MTPPVRTRLERVHGTLAAQTDLRRDGLNRALA
jgi:hypothetical protein